MGRIRGRWSNPVCVHCRREKGGKKLAKYQWAGDKFKTYVCDECRRAWQEKNSKKRKVTKVPYGVTVASQKKKRVILTPLKAKRMAYSKKLSKFFKDRNISDELQGMVKIKSMVATIDNVGYIHVRGWISHPNMHPIIHSILNKKRKRLTVDDGDYLFRYREHKVLLEALGAGKKSMDWAKQLLESGFAGNVEAMEMVVDGMSVAAARKAYGLGPGPDPTPDPIPDIDDDDFDPDDDDNVLLL
jgi:hypothetical protein